MLTTHAAAPLSRAAVSSTLVAAFGPKSVRACFTSGYSRGETRRRGFSAWAGRCMDKSSSVPPDSTHQRLAMPLTVQSLNQHVVNARYEVRGAIALRADELRSQLAINPESLPFDKVINANIGNPQQLDQRPITFFRQVLSILQWPQVLEDKAAAAKLFKPDVIERAETLLKAVGSIGAYSHSKGVSHIRNRICEFIEARDGPQFKANPESLYLTTGASGAVTNLINTLTHGPTTGFLIPIPQYPLYTATLTLANARAVPYYLEEESGWSINTAEIEKAIANANAQGTQISSIVVINPGNPTGAVLSEQNIRDIIDLAVKHDLVIIADEVYQENVFVGKFFSFRKVLKTMQSESKGLYDKAHLASLHSTSKGMIGECGQRGGYMELVGFSPEVEDQLYKLSSVSLCSVVTGQALVELMVNPPKPGDESYAQFEQEYSHIYRTLQERATALCDVFNQLEGISCQPPQGAMYLFPRITVSDKAITAAAAAGFDNVDAFYCMELLNATGICVIPGSGFGQVPGTWHFRTTFLAPVDEYTKHFTAFHQQFMDTYR